VTVSIPTYFRQLLSRRRKADWSASVIGVVAMAFALLVAAWSFTGFRLEAEHDLVDKNAKVRQEGLATIVSENFSQVLDRARLLSLVSAEWFDGNRTDAKNRLAAMRSADRVFLRIALYDEKRKLVYASSPDSDSKTLSDAIRVSLEQPVDAGDPTLRVGPISTLQEKAWQVPLLFPVVGRDGKVQGVFLAVLDLGYILDVYQGVDIGPSGAIQVLQDNGDEIARARQGGLEYSHETWGTTRIPRGQGGTQSLITDLFADGHADIVSYRRLDHYPFLVVISRDFEELLSDYAANRARSKNYLWLFTACIAGLTVWLVRSTRGRERLFDALVAADLDKQQLIVQLKDQKRHALELASNDTLTGLSNRRMFHEMGSSHLTQAKRSRKHYGLMYIDLDRFKSVNDTLGHHVGDLLLQVVAARLRSALRESDVIARIGGDEFSVLLTGLDSVDDIAVIAGKIIQSISQPCPNLDGHELRVSPSIGIAVFPQDGHNMEKLSRHADAAMYQSKQAGRGRFTFYDPALNPTNDRQFELEQSLPGAIANHELILYFQPKVRLSDLRIVGMEALVRWQHPTHGLILPGEFIPMAETTGLDVPLGDWVADACCRQLAQWQAQGLAPIPVAINVSARQLVDAQLPRRIAGYLASHGVDASLLEVEITEGSLVASIDVANKVLHDLESLGVTIALDDFGNGYSSLAYISTLPIHTIKIDRSFINDIRNNPQNVAIVDSIVTLAHKLKMRVIAEGVEVLDQLIHLKTIGCDEVQGYLLSRPVPAEAARKLIAQSIITPPQ
jgi:diguanylate cyclase (GGDEF)-like protein